jgi:type II secretory pathway pseudopilin PulG
MSVGISARGGDSRSRERGTALIVALLVMVIMTLLGIPFLLMGETENRIAENERLSLQALYAAESGARIVKRWFDMPGDATNLANPPLAALNRQIRQIDLDGNPATGPVEADGTDEIPYYKQTDDAVFDQPFRSDPVDTLLGTEDGPDIRIIESGPHSSPASRSFLADLSQKLFGVYPSAGSGRSVRISQIDVYAPPYVQVGGTWKRYGVGTVKVVGRIVQAYPEGSEAILAERSVKIVLTEVRHTPVQLAGMSACGPVDWNRELTVHWGTLTTHGETDLASDYHDRLPVGLPRILDPAAPSEDILYGYDDDDAWNAYYTDLLEAQRYPIQDPWFRLLSSDRIKDEADEVPAAPVQAFGAFDWDPVAGVMQDGDIPYNPSELSNADDIIDTPEDQSGWEGQYTNYVHGIADADLPCPEFGYEEWKQRAQEGGENVHYFTYAGNGSSDLYKLNDEGMAKPFRDWTAGGSGLYFFDTQDGLPPAADGSNLAPPVELAGGSWNAHGLIYLNAEWFHAHDVTGVSRHITAPGEPFQDKNRNGVWDAGENWLNLDYPATDPLGTFAAAPKEESDTEPLAVGPSYATTVLLDGILVNSGAFDIRGNGIYYGGTPHIFWNDSMRRGNWIGPWSSGRVRVSRWETDL